MKILLPGGSGHLGRLLSSHFAKGGHEVVVLTRSPAPDPAGPGSVVRHVRWDGRSPGPWVAELDGADVVVNLAGRSVDCRYHKTHLTEMMASRIDSTRAIGNAIAAANRPPKTWLQMSTATVYAHSTERAHDEAHGEIGGFERHVPAYWRFSILIAEAWERELAAAPVPHTRRLALRCAVVMSRDPDGPLAKLRRLARLGFGGAVAGGAQSMSWIHQLDFVRAVEFLIDHQEVDGAVNLAAPEPLPQRRFAAGLRAACGVPLGLPASRWMVTLGAALLRTDPELVLKSRRVVPGRLLEAGFEFAHPTWGPAARDLLARPHSV